MIPPWCAFNEVHPLELRHQAPPAGVLVEARLMPAVELPPQHRSLAGRFLGTLGRMLQPGRSSDHREIGLKRAVKRRSTGIHKNPTPQNAI